MHPLRFPNSGIRAKVFVRKIGFKLHMMRFNHVELFYALVSVIGGESRRCLRGRGGHMHVVCMQRWLATARPSTGAAGHSLATSARGDRSQGQQPTRGGHLRAQQGAASPTASRGHGASRRAAAGCWLQRAVVAYARAATVATQ
ncbi:hypothetical protein GW17_00060194 [Ensete ventricosum]|nr:hypothetical protein GW17_00060194 [Ensete ventricosum]